MNRKQILMSVIAHELYYTISAYSDIYYKLNDRVLYEMQHWTEMFNINTRMKKNVKVQKYYD